MADSNSHEKDKQKNDQGGKRRLKVKYKKCHVCGASKKAEDMFTENKCSDIKCFRMLCDDKNNYHGERSGSCKEKKTD